MFILRPKQEKELKYNYLFKKSPELEKANNTEYPYYSIINAYDDFYKRITNKDLDSLEVLVYDSKDYDTFSEKEQTRMKELEKEMNCNFDEELKQEFLRSCRGKSDYFFIVQKKGLLKNERQDD